MAITAGLEHAAEDAIVIIDADLQDPPAVIAEFVQKWADGYDVVYGVRTDREGETAFKKLTAKLFYRFMSHMSDTQIPLDTGDFRLMDRRVVDTLLSMPERDRFVRGMVSWLGFSQFGVSYRRAPRLAGVTKFSFFKMVRFALDGVFSFSTLPLRLATWVDLPPQCSPSLESRWSCSRGFSKCPDWSKAGRALSSRSCLSAVFS